MEAWVLFAAAFFAEVDFDHAVRCRFGAARPVEVEEVRANGGLLKSRRCGNDAENLFEQPPGRRAGPAVRERDAIAGRVVGLQARFSLPPER